MPDFSIAMHDQVAVLNLGPDQGNELVPAVEGLLAQGHAAVVLDLARIGFLPSMHIAGIISARNRLVQVGGRLVLANLAEPIRSVFRILKLDRLFDLNLDLPRAIAAVRG